jgi:hypothetical protein
VAPPARGAAAATEGAACALVLAAEMGSDVAGFGVVETSGSFETLLVVRVGWCCGLSAAMSLTAERAACRAALGMVPNIIVQCNITSATVLCTAKRHSASIVSAVRAAERSKMAQSRK